MTFSLNVFDLLYDPVGTVSLAWDVTVDKKIDGTEFLTFKHLQADAAFLMPDYVVEVVEDGDPIGQYQITTSDAVRDRSAIYECAAEGDYLRLADRLPDFGIHSFVGNPEDGLTDLVTDWGGVPSWSVGTAPTTPTAVWLNETDKSFLYLLRTWAKLCALDIDFDTVNHEISLLDPETRGTDHGLVVEYAENLATIHRTMEPLTATRYRLFGRGNVDIGNVEDFSYHESLGLSPTEALGRRRTLVEHDDNILNTTQLAAVAAQRIAQLAQPRYTYVCDVVPIGLEDVKVGDRVGVSDTVLGVDITTTVVRRTRVLDAPWDDVLELSYLRPDFGDGAQSSIFDPSAGTGGLRPATLVLAPFDSRDPAAADFQLDGENDPAVIQAAIEDVAAMPNGGTVLVLDGTVNIDAAVVPVFPSVTSSFHREVVVEGLGWDTVWNVTVTDLTSPISLGFIGGLRFANFQIAETATDPDADDDPAALVYLAGLHVQVDNMLFACRPPVDGRPAALHCEGITDLGAIDVVDCNYTYPALGTPRPVIKVGSASKANIRGGEWASVLAEDLDELRVDDISGVWGCQVATSGVDFTQIGTGHYSSIVIDGGTPVISGITGKPFESGQTLIDIDNTTRAVIAGVSAARYDGGDTGFVALHIGSGSTDTRIAGLEADDTRLDDDGTGTLDVDAGAGGGASTLDDLTDVDTSGQTAGDVLTSDGTNWSPAAPAGGFSGDSHLTAPVSTLTGLSNGDPVEFGSETVVGTDLELDGDDTTLRALTAGIYAIELNIQLENADMSFFYYGGATVTFDTAAPDRMVEPAAVTDQTCLAFLRCTRYLNANEEFTFAATESGATTFDIAAGGTLHIQRIG